MTAGVFRHSVASGDPLQDRVMLWTRVTADTDGPHDVAWSVARDEGLRDVVCTGTAASDPEADHTVHVDVDGLEPATTYYYGFEALGESSPVARTRTLPERGAERVRFAVASCASYNAGWFNAYARIAERRDLAFLLHLGDYIYETPNVLPPGAPQPPDIGRPFDPLHECVTLDDYRRRYAQYRGDPDVQALHLTHPVIATLDDHEFADGTWRDGSSWHRPEQGPFADRKAAGFRARWEWQPYRMPDPLDPTRVFRSVPLGDLAEIFLVDTRTRRDEPIAPPEMNDPARTQLGTEQREWLLGALDASTAHWRLVGNGSVMGHTWSEHLPESIRPALRALGLLGEGGSGPDPDQWDGYPVERATLLQHLREHDMTNVVVLSGDVHVGIVIELHEDPVAGDDPVAVEFVASSLTSMNIDDKMGWPRRDERSLALERTAIDTLPHWKWCEFDSNGYVVIDVDRERVQAEWWFVDTVLAPSTHEDLGARWLVEHGSQQAIEVSRPESAPGSV
ncbi:MAG: alkaline phosphatase D family protein [Acidimicrobiia bacterium]|nr:alkaline phosphatase D family protein [Acidimicrobiia bacterium]